jgi:hypothetical protein
MFDAEFEFIADYRLGNRRLYFKFRHFTKTQTGYKFRLFNDINEVE